LSKNKKPPRARLRQVQTKTAQSLTSSLALVSLVPRLKSEARLTNAPALGIAGCVTSYRRHSYFPKTVFSKSEYDLTCFCNSVSAGHGSPVAGVSAFRCRSWKMPLASRLGAALKQPFAVGAKWRKGRLQ